MTKHVPLDTFELAALFLPGRDSYALDVLSAQLSLTQGTHRALDDVYASYDLFLHIQKEFLTLAPAIQQALSMLIQRSSWKGNILFPVSSQEEVPLEETLFGLLDTLLPHLQYGFSLSLTEKEQQFFAEEWFEEAKTVLTGTSTLLDVPLGIHYAKQLCIGMVARPTDTQHYFAFQNERLLGLLLEQLPCAGGAGVSVLMKDREPHHFLSLKRLRASLAQSHFSSEHGTMLLKIFFAFATGQTNGLKESIKLVREEQALWPLVACGESDMQDSEELFLQAYLHERAQVPVLLGTHHLALKHLGRNQFPLERRLSFLQGQHLGKSMSFASKHEVQLSRLLGISAFLSALTYGAPAHVEERLAQYALDLEGKSTMLFGLLGVWFQKDAAPSVQENTLTFAPHLATLLSWVPVKSLLEKIFLLCEEIALFLEQELPFFVDAYHGQIEEVKILFPLFITEETPALRKIQLLGDDGFAFVTFTPETTERVRHTLTQLPAFFFFAHGLTLTDPQGKS
jgi:hypothetical protein